MKVFFLEAVDMRYSLKNDFLNISQNSHENTSGVSFLIIGLQLYLKRKPGKGVFL